MLALGQDGNFVKHGNGTLQQCVVWTLLGLAGIFRLVPCPLVEETRKVCGCFGPAILAGSSRSLRHGFGRI
jgi:hypothetical protein